MTLTRFLVFAAAAKHLNTTRAAEELRISQPAVRQHLKLLEQDYRTTLYQRKGRGIELTAAGTHLLHKVSPILAQIEELRRSFRTVVPPTRFPPLVVGTSYGPTVSLVPPLLALFERRFPSVSITLRTATSSAMERLVKAGRVEIAVVSRAASSRLVSEPFRASKLVAFVPKDHPLAKKRGVKLSDLLRFPLLTRKGNNAKGGTERFLQLLRSKRLRPKIALQSDSTEAVKAAVKRKMGVGILYEDVIAPDIKRGDFHQVVVPDLKRIQGQSYIIYPREESLSTSGRAFLALLRKRSARAAGPGNILRRFA